MASSLGAMLMVAAALMARGAAAQGANTLVYQSASSGCPTFSTCVTAGFAFMYDASGNIIFLPLDQTPGDACQTFIGDVTASSAGSASGTLSITADGSTYLPGTYLPAQ